MKGSTRTMIVSKPFFISALTAVLIFSMTGTSYQQVELFFDEEGVIIEEEEEEEGDDAAPEEGVEEPCIGYEAGKTLLQ